MLKENKGHISESAAERYAHALIERLVFIADDTLLTCARSFQKSFDVPYWRNVPVDESGMHYLQWFFREGFELMIETYPLLIKKILSCVDMHYKNFCDFWLKFEADVELLASKFKLSSNELVIQNILCNLSDAHNSGKTVFCLIFQTGERLYYKPRFMDVDLAWASFIERLDKAGFPGQLYAPQILDRGTYGYMEEIEYCAEEASEEELRLFYRNAGGLCCIVSMLGGSDFHHENIIAKQKTIPVLIDVETIITPKPAPLYGFTDSNQFGKTYTHVGRTLMLQRWVGNSPAEARDIGGFTSEQITEKNIPNGKEKIRRGAEFYIEEFISGYDVAYNFFMENKEKIQRQNWLSVFETCRFRYVFRRTALYYSLIKHFYSATFMRNDLYFEGAISRFGAGILLNFEENDAKKIWEIVKYEKESARRVDIPYFVCTGNSIDLYTTEGLCVNNFFDATPVELASQNLDLMNMENKLREIQFITMDLKTCLVQKQFGDKTPLLSYQNIARPIRQKVDDIRLAKEIDKLIGKINSFELKPGSFEYYAPVRNRKTTRYNLEVLSTDIYSGILGILIILAAYSKLQKDRKLRVNVLEKMASIYAEEYHTGRKVSFLNLSYTRGVSGFIQSAMIIADLLNCDRLLEMALDCVLNIPETHIERTVEFDFFSGLSGTLYYISKLYKRIPDNKLKLKIEYISNEILKRAEADANGTLLWKTGNEYQPLTGLAHGQCGIAIALLEAWKITDNDQFYKIAGLLFDYESSCYSEKENNWFDFRKFDVKLRGFDRSQRYIPRFMYGYCAGAPGIGISRIIAAKQTNSQKYDSDILKTIEFCKNKTVIGNDSLCCGSSAWIELLIEAAGYFDNKDLINDAKAICTAIIPKNSNGNYILSNLNGTADISLFKGYGGIVYQFMRVLEPTEIPSVIL